MIVLERDNGIAEIRIQHAKTLNPFSRAMTLELAEICRELEADDAVKAAWIWGGAGRSFSAGGDFADLRLIQGRDAALEHLRRIVESYQALLAISKPFVAAIDHHAIGQGLQVALMADWRIGTTRAAVRMPELANGVPCPLGSVILEALLGRAAMLHLVVGCGGLDAEAARTERILDEVCDPDDLREVTLRRLAHLRTYPAYSFRVTKRLHNERFAAQLQEVRDPAAVAHADSYAHGQADAHFARILGEPG
jgi:enoyl-CoA hydratase/carnithine racemase